MEYGWFFEWQERLITISLMYARILPIFLLLPILNSGVISSIVVRNAIIFVIIIGLWPVLNPDISLTHLSPADYGILAAKEVIVGASIGFVLALPFWIFSAMGSYIDVSRGAATGSLIDPTNGQESTEIANFVNFCVCIAFLELDGMNIILEALIYSYQEVSFIKDFSINIDAMIGFLGEMIKHAFVLASPVILVLLLSECLLGLFSRFTPQLNAFSISLTIKSVIAIFILTIYFWHTLPDILPQLTTQYSQFHLLEGKEKE